MSEENTNPEDDNLILDDDEAEIEQELNAVEDEMPSSSIMPDEVDVDAALAAVSQLTLMAEDEEIASDETENDDLSSDDTPEDENTVVEIVDEFEIPRDITMARGQLASILPAVTLIILGGWLTFTLTTTNTIPSTGLILSVILIGIGVVFLSQWLNSSRWSRGNFFIGLSTLLIGGVQLYLSQVAPSAVTNGWTLWIIAIGLALFGTGYLTLPRLPRLSIMGILTIVTGGIGYVLTSGAISTEVIGFISNLWIVGAVILAIMLLSPFLRRRNR